MIAVAVSCFVAGLTFAIPLGFWVSRGFRFAWAVPAWRFDPESLDEAEAPSDTLGVA